jgi:plastocyanin
MRHPVVSALVSPLLALTLSAAPAVAAPLDVAIHSMSYAPVTLDAVALGSTVRWTNITNPNRLHDVSSSLTGYFHSALLPSGKTFTMTFQAAGTFTYVCSIHDVMLGAVAVPLVAQVVHDAGGTHFHIRLGTGPLAVGSHYRYVLLRQDPGADQPTVVRVSRGAVVDITPTVAGDYVFVARLKDITLGLHSGDTAPVTLSYAP